MTAATSGRSLGTCASPSTIDAIVSTSYGVRFLLRAYERFSLLHFDVNSPSWSCTSWADVDLRSKLYVSGKRKPSSGSFLLPEAGDHLAASRSPRGTPFPESLTFRCDSCSAIFATAVTRAAICARVKPSGKTIAELPQLADRGRRRRGAAGPAAARDSRRDQHGADAYERAAHHSR